MNDTSSGSIRDPVEQLLESFLARWRRGERPSLEEYAARCPERADEIRELFPALIEMEQLKPAVAVATGPHERPSVQPEPAIRPEPPHPERLGDYRILRVIGEGGMGVVYEAEHESLSNRVALKVMHVRFRADGPHLRRFRQEARSAARLHHTNIVPVFAFGEQDGICYYAMQYIAGHSLDQVLEDIRQLRRENEGSAAAPETVSRVEEDERRPAVRNDPGQAGHRPTDALRRTATLGLLTGRYAGAAHAADPEAGDSSISRATPASAVSKAREADPVADVAAKLAPGIDTTIAVEDGQTQPVPGPMSPEVGPALARSTVPYQPPPDAPAAVAPAGCYPGSAVSSLTGQADHRYYREVARLLAQAADALDYAHRQGVVHRDIKPSNLLLDAQGNIWVTDFGLAKLVEGEDLSQSRDVVGTLRFMGPERFRGVTDRRSDIYALGATLYELLSLRPAFPERDQVLLIDQIVHQAPAPLQQHDHRIPRDLETIVAKALAKDPKDRFATAGELRDELRRFLENRPIRSRPIGPAERLWRWGRRNPVVAGLLALVLALSVGGTIAAGLAANYFRNLARAEAHARGRADSLVQTERQANELASRRATEAQASRLEADAKAREAKAVADFLVMDLIGAAAPGKGQGAEMTVGEALVRADATIDTRFADEPLLAATIHYRMGETYWKLTDLVKAASHWRAAAGLRAKHLGPDARETLLARQRLVIVLREMGNREEARTIGEEVLERQRRALGPEDPDTLVTMLNMGVLQFHYSDDRAPEYYRRLHEALARVNGPVDLNAVNALQHYAWTFRARGKFDRAEEMYRHALELRIRGEGEVGEGTFWTMNELLELVVHDARKYDVAWVDAERFWPVLCRALNPDHHDLLRMTDSLLRLAATSGWARAESLFRRVANALATELGLHHIRTLYVRALLARAMAEQDRTDEAVAIASELLEGALVREANSGVEIVFEHVIAAINQARDAGPRRDELALRLRARAEQWIVSDKPKEAVTLLLLAIRLGAKDARSYDDLRRIAARLAADDRVSKALADHGQVLEQGRDPDGALAAFREAIRLDPKKAAARFGIGRILHQRGDRAGALAAFREALRLKADLWDAYPFLARLDPGAMEDFDQQAGVTPMDRNEVAWRLVTASDALLDPRSMSVAVRLVRAAVKAEPRNGAFRNTLGVALYRAGDWTQAIVELGESVRLLGNDSYSHNGFFLAMAHWQLGDAPKARAYFDRSVLWMESHAPSDPELKRFRTEAEAVVRLDPVFPADPFAH